MALLHRDRTATDADDTVAGPAWPTTAETIPDDHAVAGPSEIVVRRNSFGQTLRTILATVVLVAVVAVAAANTDEITVDLLFEEYEVSVAGLVGGTAFAGFLIGALLAWRGKRARAAF
jgi:uncharacterized integral membrane protein